MPELHGNIGLNTVKAVALESAVTCSRLSLESLASTRRSRYFQAGGTWLSGRHSLDAFGPSCRCEDAARVCAATLSAGLSATDTERAMLGHDLEAAQRQEAGNIKNTLLSQAGPVLILQGHARRPHAAVTVRQRMQQRRGVCCAHSEEDKSQAR